ncbi:MAG: alpha-L-arabinofuranosidase C-terminal domain-containing protein [Verrucomicrobiota bacterium JB022]|nr:alpha-L-arabinofuranosidase C-terminal domain-containing protein [Verrucomicrobiota bacterium JB022]
MSPAAPLALTVKPDEAKAISPHLFGLFFEDINWGADGGLYPERIRNRSFEFSAMSHPTWNNFTGWELVERGGGRAWWSLDQGIPLHPNNPHALVLHVREPGEGAGIRNEGFDGIVLEKGAKYDVSFFGRLTYMGARWGGEPFGDGSPMPVVVRLESESGEVLGEASFDITSPEWEKHTATITAKKSDPKAHFVLLGKAPGGIALDMISVFPQDTFKGRPNGMRPDLAQVLADLKPGFLRFPGGCVAHGHNLSNMYRWPDTIGPLEERRGMFNLWGYHQSMGIGYHEYFQFSEDLGAEPLPVVPAGVCCQNAGHTKGGGQHGIPLDDMDAYIQEVLDLIEYANGPVSSEWGAKRAANGHPEPFNLKWLGVGNEDHITPVFEQRFRMIYDAVKEKHPEIEVIGTSGPFWHGPDFDAGWKLAREIDLPMVDEHYYVAPEWFLENQERYDSYDRNESKVYLGEYAAHEPDRANTLRSALAEAAFMTGLERNGDIVHFASYAPLLGREGHTQWRPDLIYFTGTDILLTPNYHVQKLFAQHAGDTFLPVEVGGQNEALSVSCVKDSQSGDVIIKLVNNGDAALPVSLDPSKLGKFARTAKVWTLAGDLKAVNTWEQPDQVAPQESTLPISAKLERELPAHSLTVIRLPAR